MAGCLEKKVIYTFKRRMMRVVVSLYTYLEPLKKAINFDGQDILDGEIGSRVFKRQSGLHQCDYR